MYWSCPYALPAAPAFIGRWFAWVLSLCVAVQLGFSLELALACPTGVLHSGASCRRVAFFYIGLQLSMSCTCHWWVAVVQAAFVSLGDSGLRLWWCSYGLHLSMVVTVVVMWLWVEFAYGGLRLW